MSIAFEVVAVPAAVHVYVLSTFIDLTGLVVEFKDVSKSSPYQSMPFIEYWTAILRTDEVEEATNWTRRTPSELALLLPPAYESYVWVLVAVPGAMYVTDVVAVTLLWLMSYGFALAEDAHAMDKDTARMIAPTSTYALPLLFRDICLLGYFARVLLVLQSGRESIRKRFAAELSLRDRTDDEPAVA